MNINVQNNSAMEKEKPNFGLFPSGEVAAALGFVVAKITSPPIDYDRARKEYLLEKEFGCDAFGARIPQKHFHVRSRNPQVVASVL